MCHLDCSCFFIKELNGIFCSFIGGVKAFRSRNCLPFASTWVHPLVFSCVCVAHLFSFVCCGLFSSSSCVLCTQCLWIAPSVFSSVCFWSTYILYEARHIVMVNVISMTKSVAQLVYLIFTQFPDRPSFNICFPLIKLKIINSAHICPLFK